MITEQKDMTMGNTEVFIEESLRYDHLVKNVGQALTNKKCFDKIVYNVDLFGAIVFRVLLRAVYVNKLYDDTEFKMHVY